VKRHLDRNPLPPLALGRVASNGKDLQENMIAIARVSVSPLLSVTHARMPAIQVLLAKCFEPSSPVRACSVTSIHRGLERFKFPPSYF
jgi:hypothetical protein